jgi:hypothetical protein
VALQLNARPRPGPSLQQKLFFAIEDAIVAARARLGKGRKQTVPAE